MRNALSVPQLVRMLVIEREGGRERGREIESEKEGMRERKSEGEREREWKGWRERKEGGREGGRERKREKGRERERENMVALFLFLKGMAGTLAPLSYLVVCTL